MGRRQGITLIGGVLLLLPAFLVNVAAQTPANPTVVKAPEPAPANATDAGKLKQALILYSAGKYRDTLAQLASIRSQGEIAATVAYWRGLCHFKLNEFTKATQFLEEARSQGANASDLDYSLGQAYYASQRLEPATLAFRRSKRRGYKPATSTYYLAFIAQTLERDHEANELYAELANASEDPDKVKQAALFQMAEIRYELAKKIKGRVKRERALEEIIIPAFEKARDEESDTPSYKEASARITEIEELLAKSRPPKFLTFRGTFQFGYDSNVISKADESVLAVSDQDSFVFKPTLRGNFNHQLSEKFSLLGGLRFAGKLHSRRSTPEVYKNDNFTLEPALTLERMHTLFNKKGTWYLTAEYNYQVQDYNRKHGFDYYSRSLNIELGERADFFETGQTDIKAKLKFYENYNPSSNSLQPGIDLNQKFNLGPSRISTTLAVDWLYARAAIDDTITYKFNNRYPWDIDKRWNLTPKLNFSVTDTKARRAQRGFEQKINPGLTLRRSLRNGATLRFIYDFTRNLSKDRRNQQYKRQEIAVSYEVRF